MGTHPIFESDFDCLTEGMNQMKIDDEVFNKVSLLGENKINRLNQILTKLHSPLKTPQTDLSGNPLNPFPSSGMPGMPIPLTSIQGIQTLLNQVNSVQKEIKKDAEGPLLAPPKPELPDMPFFTGAEVKTEIPTFDEPKRTPKTIQKSAEIHKKLMKTKPIGIQLKPINK